MGRTFSLVSGRASASALPRATTQMFMTPSRGARNEMWLPSGLMSAAARSGLPKMALRGMRGLSADIAEVGRAAGGRRDEVTADNDIRVTRHALPSRKDCRL